MIVLNSKKIKNFFKKSGQNVKKNIIYFKELLQEYLEIKNFGLLECPHCHSNALIKWGHYVRNIIFLGFDGITLESCLLSVQRVKCKSCGKTHAVFPYGIIPYKQFTDEVISTVLSELINNSIDNVSAEYLIDVSTINSWKHQFRKNHLPNIVSLIGSRDMKYISENFLYYIPNKLKYITVNLKCFMQIKNGIVGLNPF